GISVAGGQTVEASLKALVRASDSLANTDNSATLKIEFYDHFGAKFGSPAMLGVEEVPIADAATVTDIWNPHSISATVPNNAVEARIAVVFTQPGVDGGAIHIDSLDFRIPTTADTGDFNGDGFVDAADFAKWRDTLGQTGPGLAADGDGDGIIGMGDLAVWQAKFGQTPPSELLAAVASVPEPTSAAMLMPTLAAAWFTFHSGGLSTVIRDVRSVASRSVGL
ncbi:MAG: hypothetical protein ACR2NU_17360, partial [Aeoliella sp.]